MVTADDLCEQLASLGGSADPQRVFNGLNLREDQVDEFYEALRSCVRASEVEVVEDPAGTTVLRRTHE